MFKIMLTLHLLTAIFAVGPLVHAVTTASRGLRTGDAAAVGASARMTRIYALASIAAVFFGFGLMSADSPHGGGKVAEMADPFIWISTLLWVAAVALALGLIAPTLEEAGRKLGAGEAVAQLTGRVAAAGGVTALIFTAIIFLMVYKPGS